MNYQKIRGTQIVKNLTATSRKKAFRKAYLNSASIAVFLAIASSRKILSSIHSAFSKELFKLAKIFSTISLLIFFTYLFLICFFYYLYYSRLRGQLQALFCKHFVNDFYHSTNKSAILTAILNSSIAHNCSIKGPMKNINIFYLLNFFYYLYYNPLLGQLQGFFQLFSKNIFLTNFYHIFPFVKVYIIFFSIENVYIFFIL